MRKLVFFLVIIFMAVLVSSQSLREVQDPSKLPTGRDQNIGFYKYSRENGFVLKTEPSISCEWRNPLDTIKYCSAIMEVEAISGGSIFARPNFDFFHTNPNAQEQNRYFSSSYITETRTRWNWTKTNGTRIQERARKWVNWRSLPFWVNSNRPFAIKYEYTIPLHEADKFDTHAYGGNMNVQIDPTISACATLTNTTEPYTLSQSVNSSGSCFTMGNSNVVLDCANFEVNHGASGSGSGVIVSGVSNITIRNCIFKGNNSGAQYSISADGGQYLHAYNNTFYASGAYFSNVILNNYADSRIFNNTFDNNATGAQGTRFFEQSSTNNSAFGNTINMSGPDTTNGLFIDTDASNNYIYNNSITQSAQGIRIDLGTNHTRVYNNSVVATDVGVYVLAGGNNNNILDNKILASSYAIQISTGANGTLVRNNVLNSTAASAIRLDFGANSNRFESNTLTAPSAFETSDTTGDGFTNFIQWGTVNGSIDWEDNGTFGLLRDIEFASNLNVMRTGKTFNINNNTVGINTTDLTGYTNYNTTMNITMNLLPFTNVTEIFMLHHFEQDASTIRSTGFNCLATGQCIINSYNTDTGTLNFDTSYAGSWSANGSTKPFITFLAINSTTPTANLTSDNITAHVGSSDADGESVKLIYNWYLNGTSDTVLNVPFERVNSTNTNNTKDYSGTHGFGDQMGNSLWNSTGGYDGRGAYTFNNVDAYLNYTDVGAMDFGTSQNFAISAWVKTGDTTRSYIFSKYSSSGARIYMDKATSTGRVDCFLRDTVSVLDSVSGTSNIQDNMWHHVLCNINRTGNVSVYVDGIKEGSSSLAGLGNLNNNEPIHVGSLSGNNHFWGGEIDDLVVWNRSLSPHSIRNIFRNGTGIVGSDETNKGNNWSFKVTPNDGNSDGASSMSQNLTVKAVGGPAPPTFDNPWAVINSITPAAPNSSHILSANATYFLNGTGSGGILQFDWYINGSLAGTANTTGHSNNTIGLNNLSAQSGGNIIYYTVTPFNGSDQGNTIQSSNITINDPVLNRTPYIQSVAINPASPTTLVNITATAIYGHPSGEATGFVQFRWYNNGTLFLTVNSSPATSQNGSTINNQQGTFGTGSVIFFNATPWNGTIQGPSVLSSNVTVSAVTNANFSFTYLPLDTNFTASRPDRINLTISLNDTDNDVGITWYLDGSNVSTYPSYKILSNNLIYGVTYNLSAVLSDGTNMQRQQWTVTIGERANLFFVMLFALAIVATLFLYFAFHLDKEHFLLKLLLIFFALALFILMVSLPMNGLVATQSTAFQIVAGFFLLFAMYFTVYLFYHWTKQSQTFIQWLKRIK